MKVLKVVVVLGIWLSACGIGNTPSRPAAAPTAMPATAAANPTATEGIVSYPQTPFVDTHMHLDGVMRNGQFEGYADAAANLSQALARNAIAKAMVMEVPPVDYHDLLAVAAAYPGQLYVMAGGTTLTGLMEDTSPAEVTPQIKAQFAQTAQQIIDDGAVGFGEMLSMHLCLAPNHSYHYVSPDHPLFLQLADIAADNNVPIDIHMEAVPESVPMPSGLAAACDQNPDTLLATIPAFETLLAHNPNTRIVWQHVGWDNTGYLTPELVDSLLGTYPNLYIGLRVEDRLQAIGGGPMPNRIVDGAGEIEPAWAEVIGKYVDRFMLGGDEFVGIPGVTPPRVTSLNSTWDLVLRRMTPDWVMAIGSDNPIRVYNLP